jgi:hypothetical protein
MPMTAKKSRSDQKSSDKTLLQIQFAEEVHRKNYKLGIKTYDETQL